MSKAVVQRVHSKFTDLVEKQIKADDDDPELARPDEEKMKEVFWY